MLTEVIIGGARSVSGAGAFPAALLLAMIGDRRAISRLSSSHILRERQLLDQAWASKFTGILEL
jgi:hypothetical protein